MNIRVQIDDLKNELKLESKRIESQKQIKRTVETGNIGVGVLEIGISAHGTDQQSKKLNQKKNEWETKSQK